MLEMNTVLSEKESMTDSQCKENADNKLATAQATSASNNAALKGCQL